MMDSKLCFITAHELVKLLQSKQVSAKEVVQAHLSHIDRVNPKVNAIVTLVGKQALDQAEAADKMFCSGHDVGPLHGIPIAHKDLTLTKDVRTTFGSSAFQDYIPDQNSLIVERLKKAGAITIGKTNTPEFGAGSQTFNEVFGKTLNPYDTSKTCGGSSGGAAVSLACRMQPLADGSDTGGSLRNPANFCNVVGFRPSPGRVPVWPNQVAWYPISVEGPMARTVEDTALMLSVIAGPDNRSPISITEPGSKFSIPLQRNFLGVRIAWSANLGNLPVDPRVTQVIEGQKKTFQSLGCLIQETEPDLQDAEIVFKTLRAWRFELSLSRLSHPQKNFLKGTLHQEIEAAKKLKGTDLSRAELKRTEIYHRVRTFMETHEFLICPVNQVPPFNVDEPYVKEINGIQMKSYIDWMQSCWAISILGLPAISVPAGFTPDGLPVGLQIVGRHHDDLGVLQLAHAFEKMTCFWKQTPPLLEN